MKNLKSHYTATGFVVNKASDKILFIFHKKLQIWLPPGGHLDEGELPHETVVREVFEETGINARIIDPLGDLCFVDGSEVQIPTPYAIFHEKIPVHGTVEPHLHYDFLYHMQALTEDITHAEREVEHCHWFTLAEVLDCKTTEGSKAICRCLLKG